MRLSAFFHETIDIGNKPISLTTYNDCEEAFLTLSGSDIRFRYDGGDPTSTIGHILYAGHSMRLDSNNKVMKFRAIAINESASLSVTYERP